MILSIIFILKKLLMKLLTIWNPDTKNIITKLNLEKLLTKYLCEYSIEKEEIIAIKKSLSKKI